ncbi:MAG: hypothetical protein R3C62_06530 [Chloroflexota bacterium]
MTRKEIPDNAIEVVARHINSRNNKNFSIPVVGSQDNIETPQIFEILPFEEIDDSNRRFYAVDGSYNSEQFYNGLSVGIYTAGYVCYQHGKPLRVNEIDDPVILGKAYYPDNVLVTNEDHHFAIYDELLSLAPVHSLLAFFQEDSSESVFAYNRDIICNNLSTLLAFCQEVLEWAMVFEIAQLPSTKRGDFILRDGTLRSLQIKQAHLVKLGKYLHDQGLIIVGITKQSPIKMELAYTFKQIDNYLQDHLKYEYPFKATDLKRKKLCCWFEVPESVLLSSYGRAGSLNMFARKDIRGGRGFGLFMVARLDYVEKLQNYDWLVADVNIFDAIPGIADKDLCRQGDVLQGIFQELTRLTQEHYILGYPYPLVEAHNFVSLKKGFKDEIINRVKYSLYKDQRMDNVDIENLFLDIHDRF